MWKMKKKQVSYWKENHFRDVFPKSYNLTKFYELDDSCYFAWKIVYVQ